MIDEAMIADAVGDEGGGDEGVGEQHLTDTADEAPVRTGDDTVDAVLDSLEELSQLPLEAHVGVFERAHDQLRAALDGPRA